MLPTVMADGSRDRGNAGQDTTLIGGMEGGKLLTLFVELVSVCDANVTNIAGEINTTKNKLKWSDWPDNVVSHCSDGALVIVGQVLAMCWHKSSTTRSTHIAHSLLCS